MSDDIPAGAAGVTRRHGGVTAVHHTAPEVPPRRQLIGPDGAGTSARAGSFAGGVTPRETGLPDTAQVPSSPVTPVTGTAASAFQAVRACRTDEGSRFR